MRNSNLLRWASPGGRQSGKNGNKAWIHSPDALQRGHVAYLVKFLGHTEVDEAKGIEVVKEGIRKLTFNQQLKKSEGSKIPKVELTISIDGVAIQEPKTKRIMNQYPLHRISYCADDKGEKKFFSFIAKEQESDQHVCFVFVSDKLAEEITLTIGQAFDLAYRRFLETSGKELETHRHIMMLQQKTKRLEYESTVLRQRLSDISKLCNKKNLEDWMNKEGLSDLTSVGTGNEYNKPTVGPTSLSTPTDLLSGSETFVSKSGVNGSAVPPVPPRFFEASSEDLLRESPQPTVGTKLEGLLLDDFDDFNPRAYETELPSSTPLQGIVNPTSPFYNDSPAPLGSVASPPVKTTTARPRPHASNANGHGDGFFPLAAAGPSAKKTNANNTDLFGMEAFSGSTGAVSIAQYETENPLGFLDKRILEMKDGFSRGLAFGNDDFSLESLDPLRN